MSCGNRGVAASAGGNSVDVERGGPSGAASGGPCGACKFLRRKCVSGCVFAPHFGADAGAAHFAAVHRVFGASNAAKLLQRVPTHRRPQAVRTMCYEAHARLRDPVLGCVSRIFDLQQQVLRLEAELGLIQTRLATVLEPPRPPAPEAPGRQPSQLAGGGCPSSTVFDPLQLHDPVLNDAESSCCGEPAQVLQVEHDEVLEELATGRSVNGSSRSENPTRIQILNRIRVTLLNPKPCISGRTV